MSLESETREPGLLGGAALALGAFVVVTLLWLLPMTKPAPTPAAAAQAEPVQEPAPEEPVSTVTLAAMRTTQGIPFLPPATTPKPKPQPQVSVAPAAPVEAAPSEPAPVQTVAMRVEPAPEPVMPLPIPEPVAEPAVEPAPPAPVVAAIQPAPMPEPIEVEATPQRPQNLVYLVDTSGSLLDSLPELIHWLGSSLDNLHGQQRFTVIFFRQGELLEVPPVGLKPAEFRTKAEAWQWMQPAAGHVWPGGRSDVVAAVEAALAYEPDAIYLLSDDRYLPGWSPDGQELLTRLDEVLSAHEPVTLHTVQFFYRDEAGALEAMADRFGGTYRFVAPENPAGEDPLLLLLELSAAP